MLRMHGNDLLDKDIVGINGWKIGKSKDIYIENSNWQITYLDIELRGNIENELGMDSFPLNRNHFPVATSHIQGVGDVITLNLTKDEIVARLMEIKKSRDAEQRSAPQATF
jgi:sporulation protein YlmC with PRC-barrel domain